MVVRALPWGELEAPMFAVNSSSFSLRIAVHLATIGPRSWSWPSVDRYLIDWQRFPHVNLPIAARSRRDRGSIGPRSWRSSTIVLCRRIKIHMIVNRTIAVLRAIRCRPHDGDRTHQEAPRIAQIANDLSRLIRAPDCEKSQRFDDLNPMNLSPNLRTCLIYDRVDSGPRDHRR